MVCKGAVRWGVVLFFHATTVLVVMVSMCAYQYLKETGTTLDYENIAEWILKFDGVAPILFQRFYSRSGYSLSLPSYMRL
jgi:hypothetical protein